MPKHNLTWGFWYSTETGIQLAFGNAPPLEARGGGKCYFPEYGPMFIIFHFFQAFFRDHRSIDYTDSQRELRVQQDLKWSSDPPILLSPVKSDGDEMNPILRSPSLQISQNNRKWNKAHFQLKGDPHLGPVLMYAPRVQQQFVAFTTATNSASSKVRHPFE